MPNWCEGQVTIYSNSIEVLEKIIQRGAKGTWEKGEDWDSEKGQYKTFVELPNKFSFENFVPTPPEKLGEGGDWYGWRVDNWGTKWDLAQDEIEMPTVAWVSDPDYSYSYQIDMGFMTAWSPAVPLFGHIAKEYGVAVEYKYVEEGMEYFGVDTIDEDGAIYEDCRTPTQEDLKVAGYAFDKNGDIDWDSSDDTDLFRALDYWKEYDYEESK